jgi:hypothetical protein
VRALIWAMARDTPGSAVIPSIAEQHQDAGLALARYEREPVGTPDSARTPRIACQLVIPGT